MKPNDSASRPLVYSRLPMKNIKAMLVDTLKVHEYDVFALRPLDIQMFNELYETICGLSVLCNEGKALTATIAAPLGGGGIPMRSTSSSGDGTGAAGRGAGGGTRTDSLLTAISAVLQCTACSSLCQPPCFTSRPACLVLAKYCCALLPVVGAKRVLYHTRVLYWITAEGLAPSPEPESDIGAGGAAEEGKTLGLEQQPNPAALPAPSDTGGADGDGRIDTL